MTEQKKLLCIGTALVDSIIKGFDKEPVSASGFRAESSSLNVGGEAVNEAVTAAKLGMNTIPREMQIFIVPLSRILTTTRASRILGNEARPSFSLIRTSSTIPP